MNELHASEKMKDAQHDDSANDGRPTGNHRLSRLWGAPMFGTVVGVFIPVVLASGLVIVGVQSFWQQVMIGAILIVAVYFDQLRRRSRSRG